jgi:phosphoribosylanthranilate isomerase
MFIKICGITNLEDAEFAVESGADALGFLLWNGSPRYISPEKVKEITSKIPQQIEKVGLFVNASADEINRTFQESGITLAQLHFEISDDEVAKLEVPYIHVVRAKNRDDLNRYGDKIKFVDAFVEEYGGAGKRLNLDWFRDRDNSKTIIAGGLNPDNLKELDGFGFYGVDVSSGVEESKGKKSHQKVREFIKNAKKLR